MLLKSCIVLLDSLHFTKQEHFHSEVNLIIHYIIV